MNLFDPNSYTHLPDDAAMIQAAVDAARETGASVVIPRHNERTGKDLWDLPRAVLLYSGSSIVLDNCFLRQSDDSIDNIFRNSICRTPEGTKKENRQYDIHIQGIGNATLDGGKYNGICEGNWREKGVDLFGNCLIHFQNVERFVVENLTLSNQRYWAMNHHCCSEGRLSNLRLNAWGDRPNQDGIDFRYGCHTILIENIMGYSGDDVVALTCLNDRDGGLMVEGMDSSIHNVIIRNVQAVGREDRGIVRLLNNYGRKIYNIIIENVIDLSQPGDPWRDGSCVRINELAYLKNRETDLARFGDTYNITVRNIVSRCRHGVFASATLENALIDNVQMFGDGGAALLLREGEFKNIRVRNLTFSNECDCPETDDNPTENAYNRRRIPQRPVEENRVYGVYFQGATVRNMNFDGITCGKSVDALFGGYGDVECKARDIFMQNENVPLLDVTEGVKVDIREF